MHRFLLIVAALAASSGSGCILNANSAARVAAGRAHIPIDGNVSSLSADDLTATVRALGTWPIYRLHVIDHDHVEAYLQSLIGRSDMGPEYIERIDGKWRAYQIIVTS